MKQEEKVVEILKKHQLKLTTIESCTAGAIAARIVDVPGASEVFRAGLCNLFQWSKNACS